jgi:hypothetical protein
MPAAPRAAAPARRAHLRSALASNSRGCFGRARATSGLKACRLVDPDHRRQGPGFSVAQRRRKGHRPFVEHLVGVQIQRGMLNEKRSANGIWALSPASCSQAESAARCRSGALSRLLVSGPVGPSPLGLFRPSNTFSPSSAHEPRDADVMLTSAAFELKILFFSRK